MLKGEVRIPWVNSEWTHQIDFEFIQNNWNKQDIGFISDKYLQIYLNNTTDIRKWPNADWGYAGILGQLPCSDNLTWNKCSYQWKDPSQYTWLENIKRSVFGGQSFNGELLSYLSEVMKGEPCPNWGIIIIKISGCPHMVCQKCSYEFWWDWLGYYKDYQHLDGTPCPLRVFILFPIFWFFLAWINFKLCYSITLIATIQKSVLYFVFMLIMSTLILGSLWIEAALLKKLKIYKRHRPNYRGWGFKTTWAATILYPILWAAAIEIFYNQEITHGIIVFLFYEAWVIIIGGAIAFAAVLVYKMFLKFYNLLFKDSAILCKNLARMLGVFYQQIMCRREQKVKST